MAEVERVNPTIDATRGRAFLGGTVNAFEVNAGVALTNEMDGPGAFQQMLQALSSQYTITGHSALRGGDAVFTILIEGEFGTDTYDGTNSETLAEHLEDLVQALGSIGNGPVSMAGATVAPVDGFPMYANHV